MSRGAYETTLDIVEELHALAARARAEGWDVNVACETGSAERLTFAAQRPAPEPA